MAALFQGVTPRRDASGRVPIGLGDHALGAFMGAVWIAWLLGTVRDLGFSRDEGFYFHAAQEYAGWFKTLFAQGFAVASERGVVDRHWAANHEHPSLVKSLFALSWLFFHKRWHVFADASTAFRLPGIAFAGVAMWVTYLFGARVYSRRAGIAAAWLLVLAPNVAYHCHLACFDVPIMAMWVLCIYVYWRGAAEGGLGWALLAGLVYGLTLETKHNAWILPAVFVPHALVVHWRRFVRGADAGVVPLPANLLAMATLGPLVFLALWPWLWNDTLQRVGEYIGFHLNHEYYNIEFLRRNYWGPPSPKLYAPVMILATIPSVTLLLFLVGAFDRLSALVARVARAAGAMELPSWLRAFGAPRRRPTVGDRRAEPDLLFFLAFGAALGPFFLERTPVFGGTKHWMTAYPFLALLAGRGFDIAASAAARALQSSAIAERRGARVAVELGIAAAVVAPCMAVTAYSHPFGLSAYVPLVGGAQGAADLGLNRQFWGFTTQSAAPYLAAHAPPGATVFFHDTAWESWYRMLDEDRVRRDLRGVTTPGEAQFSLVHHELHMNAQEYNNWFGAGTAAPDHVVTHNGVPIVSVFKKQPEAR